MQTMPDPVLLALDVATTTGFAFGRVSDERRGRGRSLSFENHRPPRGPTGAHGCL